MMMSLLVTPTAPSSSVIGERVHDPTFNRAISPPSKKSDHHQQQQQQQQQQPSIKWATTETSYHPLTDMLHGGHQLVDWPTIWAEIGTTTKAAAEVAKSSYLDVNHPPRQDHHTTSGILESNPWAAGCLAASDTTLMTTTTTATATTNTTTEDELWLALPKKKEYSTFDQAQDSITKLPRTIRKSPALLQDDDDVSCLDDTDEESDYEEEVEEEEEEEEFEEEKEEVYENEEEEDERSQAFVPVRTIWITVARIARHGTVGIDRLHGTLQEDEYDDADDEHSFSEENFLIQEEGLTRLKQNRESDQGIEYGGGEDDDEENW